MRAKMRAIVAFAHDQVAVSPRRPSGGFDAAGGEDGELRNPERCGQMKWAGVDTGIERIMRHRAKQRGDRGLSHKVDHWECRVCEQGIPVGFFFVGIAGDAKGPVA